MAFSEHVLESLEVGLLLRSLAVALRLYHGAFCCSRLFRVSAWPGQMGVRGIMPSLHCGARSRTTFQHRVERFRTLTLFVKHWPVIEELERRDTSNQRTSVVWNFLHARVALQVQHRQGGHAHHEIDNLRESVPLRIRGGDRTGVDGNRTAGSSMALCCRSSVFSVGQARMPSTDATLLKPLCPMSSVCAHLTVSELWLHTAVQC